MFNGILAIAFAFFLMKYREKVVEQTGKFAFAEKYLGQGGTYRFFLLMAVAIFIWGISSMTGTTDVLFSPLRAFFVPAGGGGQPQGGGEWDF